MFQNSFIEKIKVLILITPNIITLVPQMIPQEFRSHPGFGFRVIDQTCNKNDVGHLGVITCSRNSFFLFSQELLGKVLVSDKLVKELPKKNSQRNFWSKPQRSIPEKLMKWFPLEFLIEFSNELLIIPRGTPGTILEWTPSNNYKEHFAELFEINPKKSRKISWKNFEDRRSFRRNCYNFLVELLLEFAVEFLEELLLEFTEEK